MRIARILSLLAVVSVAATRVVAQGCSMCATTAAQQSAEEARALNLGILVLLLPSMLLFGAVLFTAFRRRDDMLDPEISAGESDPETPGTAPARPLPPPRPRHP